MARVTRSGTLVGPGTKRKWRPAMMTPPIECWFGLLTKTLAQAQPPKSRARFPFLDHDFQNWKPVSRQVHAAARQDQRDPRLFDEIPDCTKKGPALAKD